MLEKQQGDELPEGYRSTEPVPYLGYPSYWQPPGNPPSSAPGEVSPPYPFPPNLYVPPPVPPISSPSPSRRKSVRWILAGIVVLLLLAGLTSFFVIRYINRSTPDKTLDAFCSALQRSDYQTAYNQFTARLQQNFSEAAFATILAQDKVTTCTHSSTAGSGSSVTGTLKLVHASKGVNNDVVTLTPDNNNNWKIDNIYKQS